MSHIYKNIYLGSLRNANDINYLESNNIKHVITLCHSYPFSYDDISYHYYPISDKIDRNPFTDYKVIKDIVDYQENVLIHCHRGVSRSGIIVIKLIMDTLTLEYDKAFEYVKDKRQKVDPKPHFIKYCLQSIEMVENNEK
jgi:protein-tyrosine phosphatase